MKWMDISMPMHKTMQVYKNRDANRFRLTADRTHAQDHICENRMEINLHTGTHLDAPLHVIDGGNTISTFPLDLSQLPCQVLDLSGLRGSIKVKDLDLKAIRPGGAVLLKTDNSLTDAFDPEYVFLSIEGAAALADTGVRLVGTDALGIERGQPGHPTHRALMTRGVWILEGLRLAHTVAGTGWTLHVLPLNIVGAEASPVRAVLSRDDE